VNESLCAVKGQRDPPPDTPRGSAGVPGPCSEPGSVGCSGFLLDLGLPAADCFCLWEKLLAELLSLFSKVMLLVPKALISVRKGKT